MTEMIPKFLSCLSPLVEAIPKSLSSLHLNFATLSGPLTHPCCFPFPFWNLLLLFLGSLSVHSVHEAWLCCPSWSCSQAWGWEATESPSPVQRARDPSCFCPLFKGHVQLWTSREAL